MQALFTLTPAEAKRLIAKAVVKLPAVQHAYRNGKLAIGNGTTNAFVVEELLGITVPKENYTAGVITAGRICVSEVEKIIKPYLFVRGQRVEANIGEFVQDFSGGDVFIKGANAVDPRRNAGILVGSRTGGTIGAVWSVLKSVGATLVIPVGLEKLVPHVPDGIGIDHFDVTLGMPAGLFTVTGAEVITEIEALATLCNVQATLIASGGTGGSEGSTTFAVSGNREELDRVMELVKSIKGEPPVPRSRRACSSCGNPCEFYRKTGDGPGERNGS